MRILVERRELDVLAREVAILGARASKLAKELEFLHRALLHVGVSATPGRTTRGLGAVSPPLTLVQVTTDDGEEPER